MPPPETPAPNQPSAPPRREPSLPAYLTPNYGKNNADLSRIEMPSHWAVPWSDLMMVMMVMFAVMLAVKLAEQDMREMFTPPPPAKNLEATQTSSQQVSSAMRSSAASNSSLSTEENNKAFGEFSEPAQPNPNTQDNQLPSDTIDNSVYNANHTQTPAQISPEEILRRSSQLIAQANLQDVDVALTDSNAVKVSVRGNLLFDLGKADLKPDAIRFLKELSGVIASNRFMVEVIGHTDNFPVSNPAYPTNWELSSARAARVARFLIQNGDLEPERFTVIGQSYYRPVVPNNSLANKAKNRRVDIIITRQEYTP